jgi:hypothetical protein
MSKIFKKQKLNTFVGDGSILELPEDDEVADFVNRCNLEDYLAEKKKTAQKKVNF